MLNLVIWFYFYSSCYWLQSIWSLKCSLNSHCISHKHEESRYVCTTAKFSWDLPILHCGVVEYWTKELSLRFLYGNFDKILVLIGTWSYNTLYIVTAKITLISLPLCWNTPFSHFSNFKCDEQLIMKWPYYHCDIHQKYALKFCPDHTGDAIARPVLPHSPPAFPGFQPTPSPTPPSNPGSKEGASWRWARWRHVLLIDGDKADCSAAVQRESFGSDTILNSGSSQFIQKSKLIERGSEPCRNP